MDFSRSSPRPHLVAFVGGIGIIALQFVFAAVTPGVLCDEVRPLPMLDYQFADSQAALDDVFEPTDSVCRVELAGVFSRVNLIDALLFIPAYSALMLGFFWGERARLPHLARAGFGFALLAGLADLVETLIELNQIATPATIAFSPAAYAATWIKFGSLTLAGTLAGLHLLMRGGIVPRILGTIGLLGGLAGFAALTGMSQRDALVGGTAAAWGVMLVYSAFVVTASRRAATSP